MGSKTDLQKETSDGLLCLLVRYVFFPWSDYDCMLCEINSGTRCPRHPQQLWNRRDVHLESTDVRSTPTSLFRPPLTWALKHLTFVSNFWPTPLYTCIYITAKQQFIRTMTTLRRCKFNIKMCLRERNKRVHNSPCKHLLARRYYPIVHILGNRKDETLWTLVPTY